MFPFPGFDDWMVPTMNPRHLAPRPADPAAALVAAALAAFLAPPRPCWAEHCVRHTVSPRDFKLVVDRQIDDVLAGYTRRAPAGAR